MNTSFCHVIALIITFILTNNIKNVENANILGLFTSQSKSHVIIYMGIANTLIERGHNLTIVTTLPIDDITDTKKFHHIYIKTTSELDKNVFKNYVRGEKQSATINISSTIKTLRYFMDIASKALQDEQMKHLKDNGKFDLVLLGYFFNDFQLGLGAHFKCPTIIIWMVQSFGIINDIVGNPAEISYVPHMFTDGVQPMDFISRVKNALVCIIEIFGKQYLNYFMKSYYDLNFPSDKYPSFDEIKRNVSLVLMNHHFSSGPIYPSVPALIEIGGIQIKEKPNPLPKNIKDFIENATNGIVYVSMGSNFKSEYFKPETVLDMYKVFSKIPQKVIWKFENQSLLPLDPNNKNILFGEWFPQDDILAHSNTKLFITHGGKGSVIESEYHGVPMIGIPIFGDQNSNVKQLEKEEFGIELPYYNITEQTLLDSIEKVLNDHKYTENTKRFSQIYRDRPLSPRQTAAFWVEYVIRHKGAKHIQSPAVHMNLFQKYNLDVIAFILVCTYVTIKLFVFIVKFICKLILKVVRSMKIKKD